MKVLIIHTTYKYRGGEDTVVSEEMRLLKSHGITVELLCFDNEKNALLKLLKLPFNIQSYRETKNKLLAYKPDIVHIHNLHFGGSPSVLYALKKSKVPFVTTLHNFRLICPSAMLFFKGKLFLHSVDEKFPWRAVANGVYKNSRLITLWVSATYFLHRVIGTWHLCNKYIVLTEHAKQILLQSKLNFTGKQLTIKPNFCSDHYLATSKASNYFLYVGRLSEEKGIQVLLDAFSRCNYPIKIAGDGPLKEDVIKYSNKYQNIEFLGTLKKNDVFSLLQAATALIFPSVWFEGMPLTIIEAFSCGTPVIASKLGAMETMVRNQYNGLHFKAEDAGSLKLKMDEWQNLSEEDKEQYRLNARETYERNYTPEQNAEQLLSIYNSVLGDEKRVFHRTVSRPSTTI